MAVNKHFIGKIKAGLKKCLQPFFRQIENYVASLFRKVKLGIQKMKGDESTKSTVIFTVIINHSYMGKFQFLEFIKT